MMGRKIMTMTMIAIRFIPTCVGQMAGSGSLNGAISGSSPRAWGKSPSALPRRCPGRFIPTCVGQMALLAVSSISPTVHPHVCGANGDVANHSHCFTGSSPRVWGKFFVIVDRIAAVRFIPTCVGQMWRGGRTSCRCSVHPHVRGANQFIQFVHSRFLRFIPTCVGQMGRGGRIFGAGHGSSPRVWGK